MALLGLVAAAVGVLVWASPSDGGTGRDASPTEQVRAIYARMQPLLAEWAEVRAELAGMRDRVRAQYRDLPDPLVVATLQDEIAGMERRRRRLENRLAEQLQAMQTLRPHHPLTAEARRQVLDPLCDEVQQLVVYRHKHAELLAFDEAEPTFHGEARAYASAVRFGPELAALAVIEEELGAAFTDLQRRFPDAERVRELNSLVVGWHYRQLIDALGRHHATPQAPRHDEEPLDPPPLPAVGDTDESGLRVADVNRRLLDQLERMKRLYPLSSYTRRAEQWIIVRTAKRQLGELEGWPVVTVLALVTLLLFGYVRCLTSYLKRRGLEEDDPLADTRIIRPATWAVVPSYTLPPFGREPSPVGRPASPPSVPRGAVSAAVPAPPPAPDEQQDNGAADRPEPAGGSATSSSSPS